MKNAPWYARLALILALLLPVYFMMAALGTKFGLWGWQTGLITLTATVGPILLGVAALIALVALIVCLIKKPRRGWVLALIALLIPAGMFGAAGAVRSNAASIPPIHDIATDTASPPAYPAAIMAQREAGGANPLRPFDVPLGEFEPWAGVDSLKSMTNAEVIAANYSDLKPLTINSKPADATAAVTAAMNEMGFTDVTVDEATGTISGVAETFWFGFKDDVAARIAATESGSRIDFRSTSRVGLSDLGANAKRIDELSKAIAAQ